MPIRLTPRQAETIGLGTAPPPKPGSHEGVVLTYSDLLLAALIDDIGKRNLSNYRDHETRFLGERCKAARAERKRRQLQSLNP